MAGEDSQKTPAEALFVWPARIYYEDTDAGGVVYHTNYIKFMERARTEFLRSQGIELDVMEQAHRILFAIRALSVEYRKPAHLNDLLQVTVDFDVVRSASIAFRQTVLREGELLCEGTVRVASICADSFRPKAIPDFMQAQLAELLAARAGA
jgi:acyl-CoA thioester hydrolase